MRSIHPTQEVVNNMDNNIRHNLFDEVTKMVMIDAIHSGMDLKDPAVRELIIAGLRDAIDFFDNFEFGTEPGE